MSSDDTDSLGIYAKFASDSDLVVRRFALQAAARSLLPDHRVVDCCRKPVPGFSTVDVCYSREYQRASYRHLQTCGSVWVCPVCASRITEARRVELQAAVNGRYRPVLVTLTVRHKVDDQLSVVLDALLSAYRVFTSGYAYQLFKRRYGVVGSVKSLEVTYGVSGWHPHLHLLVFLSNSDSCGLSEWVKSRWLECVRGAGLDASWCHGADVVDGWEYVAEYVAKWGHEPGWSIAHEVAKGVSKSARSGGCTPNQLLGAYLAGDESAGMLWLEYVMAFRSKSQLRWSRGLRDVLGLGVAKSDLELASEGDEKVRLLASLTLRQWRVVLDAGAVGQLLSVAQSGSWKDVWSFLDGLPGMPEGSDYHPALRAVGNLRVGDAVKVYRGNKIVRGWVRELVGSRVVVEVWGRVRELINVDSRVVVVLGEG